MDIITSGKNVTITLGSNSFNIATNDTALNVTTSEKDFNITVNSIDLTIETLKTVVSSGFPYTFPLTLS